MMSRGIFGVLDFEMKTNDCHPGTGRCRTVPQWCLDRFYSLRYTFQIQDLVSPEGRFYHHCRHISTSECSFLLRSLCVSVLPWLLKTVGNPLSVITLWILVAISSIKWSDPGTLLNHFFRHYKMEKTNIWSGFWMVYQDMVSIFFLGKYYFIEATWGLTAGKLFI